MSPECFVPLPKCFGSPFSHEILCSGSLSLRYYGALASEKLGQYLNAKRYAEQALETEAAVAGNTLAEQAMCISETEAAAAR